MKYTIKWIEQSTTSTGKLKATATLVDETGAEHDKVTIWGDYPNFAELRPSSTTLGTIQVKQNGQYTNKTLYPERTNTLGPKKTSSYAIKQAQDTKREDISHAQDRKEESIKEAAVFRDATILTNAYVQGRGMTVEEIKVTWVEFRKWLKDQQELPF